jgi:pimeloyl-ACP methyl ester carboxylesterase
MNGTAIPYTTGTVSSADDTTINYRQLGTGPGLILLSGGYLAAQHYLELAQALSDTFTVYVPDRRGRGLSGPPGPNYSMATECEDIAALLAATGTTMVFGHSSGGLIALQAALTLPAIRKVAVYEPALSMYGSFSMDWVPRFTRELNEGKLIPAMVTFSKGVQVDRKVNLLPRWLLIPMMNRLLKQRRKSVNPGEQSIDSLIPLQRLDVQIFQEMATSPGFAKLRAEVLTLHGEKTPSPAHNAIAALQKDLPNAHRQTLPGVGHEAPLNGRGSPELVATHLRTFFSA